MILVDANILLHAYNGGSPQHQAAKKWWEQQLSGTQAVRLAWTTILAFLRIGTHFRVFSHPMAMKEAVSAVSSWLIRPMVDILHPSTTHWTTLSQLLINSGIHANLTSDAHLAALAIEHGAILVSSDLDFSRFKGLLWNNPLTNS